MAFFLLSTIDILKTKLAPPIFFSIDDVLPPESYRSERGLDKNKSSPLAE